MRIIERLICNHHFHYDGEIPWFIYSDSPISKFCYLRCSKCGARKIISLDGWRKLLKKQIITYEHKRQK